MRSLVRVQYGPLEKLKARGKKPKVIVNSGDIAQLVERLLCTQEVRSSNLLISTKLLTKTNKSKSKSLATHLVR